MSEENQHKETIEKIGSALGTFIFIAAMICAKAGLLLLLWNKILVDVFAFNSVNYITSLVFVLLLLFYRICNEALVQVGK